MRPSVKSSPVWRIIKKSLGSGQIFHLLHMCFHDLSAIDVKMFQCSYVPMSEFSNVQMLKWSNFPMFKCSNVQIFKFSNFQMFQCSNFPMFKCSNVQMSNFRCLMSNIKCQYYLKVKLFVGVYLWSYSGNFWS